MATIKDLREQGHKGDSSFMVAYTDPITGNRRRPHFRTRKEAERFRAQIEAEILKAKDDLTPDQYVNAKKYKAMTVLELFEIYRRRKIRRKGKKSARKSALRALNGIISHFQKALVMALDRRAIAEYRDKRLDGL